ncbi:hypothetical protein [Candidatus Tisiphia endosymbiont of Beris chalybata]|uniref:hypothetical protein n=1 Tax=Candidatus Tisiphia endosymbiont of Beris chalybata TaxID=3066262 RepID=UPI00312C7BBA
MQQESIYPLLFTDSLLGNVVIILDSEIIVHSFTIFNNYNNLLILIIATIASLLAITINYLFGRILARIFAYFATVRMYNNYQLFVQFFSKYSIFLLCLSILPLGSKFIPLIAGFVKIRFLRVVLVSAFIKLCYYIYVIYL